MDFLRSFSKCFARNEAKVSIDIHLRPKNIIVVGGGTGIGLASAKKFLSLGAKNVILSSRNIDKIASTLGVLLEDPRVHVIAFDIADIPSHQQFLDKCADTIGEVPDGLLISSGVNYSGANWQGFNISESDYDRVMNINLKGPFFLIRNFSNWLFSNKVKGNICAVSSISAHRDLVSVYQITKNALSGIVHCYGKHLSSRGVILNCVEPGSTDTDMMKHLQEYTDGIRPGKTWGDNSLGRVLRPEEIAEIIAFCMSNLGEVMAGSCILAGGGCKSIAR